MYRFGLIGYPVRQSFSPWIHEEFFKRTNQSGMYTLHELNPETTSFKDELDILKKELHGFNVTLPYKQVIIPYLDELDPAAQSIGAVNTVVEQNGQWKGYNTDGMGYIKSLKNDYPHLFSNRPLKTLIIGAGGAARGIYDALINNGFTYIDIANRTLEHGEQVAKLGGNNCSTNVFALTSLQDTIETYDLIIQTTSVGMVPNKDVIFPLRKVKEGCVVSDIVYQPIKTLFLQQAKASGACIHFGHKMLLYQAERAFHLWTNKEVVLTNMEHDLKELLEGR